MRAARELLHDRVVELGHAVAERRDPQRRDRVEVAPAVDVDQLVALGPVDDDRPVVGERRHLREPVPHDLRVALHPVVVRRHGPILTHNVEWIPRGDVAVAREPASEPRDPRRPADACATGCSAATYRCVERFGLGKTTIDDVVKESGVSRATIYRQFPGGRDELLLETVGWELANYFNELADHVRDAPEPRRAARAGVSPSPTARSPSTRCSRKILRHRARAAAAAAHHRVGQDAARSSPTSCCRICGGRPRPAGCGPASTSTGPPSTSPARSCR